MKNIHFVFLSFLSILFLSCGDRSDLTTREFNKIQSRENTDLRLQELRNIAGHYMGEPQEHQGLYLNREDRWIKFELFLTVHTVPQEDPENINTLLVPRLGGSARWWIEGSEIYNPMEIETADYDLEIKRLTLKFKDSESTISGSVSGSVLSGDWNSSLRGGSASGRIVLKKQ